MMKGSSTIIEFCNGVVLRETFTQVDAWELSELINCEIEESREKINDWPISILLEPLKKIWSNKKIKTVELKNLIEIIFTVVFSIDFENASSLENNSETKKCPYCDRVLMSIKVPRCSWCGKELKEHERYFASENWANTAKHNLAWNKVLDKRKDCYQNWGRKFNSHSNNWLGEFLKQKVRGHGKLNKLYSYYS